MSRPSLKPLLYLAMGMLFGFVAVPLQWFGAAIVVGVGLLFAFSAGRLNLAAYMVGGGLIGVVALAPQALSAGAGPPLLAALWAYAVAGAIGVGLLMTRGQELRPK